MAKINENFLKLQKSYLFIEIARRVEEYKRLHPDKKIIKMGIGDVTRPIPKACIKALHKAIDEMAKEDTFKGYGPEQGYLFLREKIVEHDFKSRGVNISVDEIFISDGAKCDTANFQELFDKEAKVAVLDPVYPVYIDTNVMTGRAGELKDEKYSNVVYLDCHRENGFKPSPPKEGVDILYLCFPNNPTGTALTHEELKTWVDFARDTKSIILFDAAYEAFIRDNNVPHSIFEIEGAKEVAIEFRSFSKTAGFTGLRCAYTVVPKECVGYTKDGSAISLNELWHRRQSTKFNGVSYPVQRAAEAVYSEEGQREIKENINYYLRNADLILKEMSNLGFECYGGTNSPYVWVYGGKDSWEFFDELLNKAGIVCTPGSGFGKCGRGYIRLSAFNSFENVKEAMERIKNGL